MNRERDLKMVMGLLLKERTSSVNGKLRLFQRLTYRLHLCSRPVSLSKRFLESELSLLFPRLMQVIHIISRRSLHIISRRSLHIISRRLLHIISRRSLHIISRRLHMSLSIYITYQCMYNQLICFVHRGAPDTELDARHGDL